MRLLRHLASATAGDVNGDGYCDVIVGAPYYDNGQTDEGRAYVYLGSAGGPAAPARPGRRRATRLAPASAVSVATAGDVNGDGYCDVIVGARCYDNGQTDEGRAYVYLGAAAGLGAQPGLDGRGRPGRRRLRRLGGDGGGRERGRLLRRHRRGLPATTSGQTDEGRAYVYHGSAAGSAATRGLDGGGRPGDAPFGCSVATAGDVNGDGYADVIVGASGYDNGQTDEGRAYVYHGSPCGPVGDSRPGRRRATRPPPTSAGPSGRRGT